MTSRMVQLLRWPLWSWRNLIVTVGAALLIFAVIGRLTSTTSSVASPAAPAGPVAAATPSAPPTTPYDVPTTSMASTPAPVVTVPPTAGADAGVAAGVALQFVTAWARPTVPAPAWAASLAPFCTPQLAASLRTVDPGRVPASRVVGSARAAVSSHGAVVSVPTDGGSVELNLVPVDGGWKVSAIAPADAPPGAPTPLLSGATSSPDSSR